MSTEQHATTMIYKLQRIIWRMTHILYYIQNEKQLLKYNMGIGRILFLFLFTSWLNGLDGEQGNRYSMRRRCARDKTCHTIYFNTLTNSIQTREKTVEADDDGQSQSIIQTN